MRCWPGCKVLDNISLVGSISFSEFGEPTFSEHKNLSSISWHPDTSSEISSHCRYLGIKSPKTENQIKIQKFTAKT
jgi:hypothetical protein